VVDCLKRWGFTSVREVEWTQENVRFALPEELASLKSAPTEILSTS
jgi:hypothetical protein